MTSADGAIPGGADGGADWGAAWVEALDALELDVARAEQVLAAVHTAADVPDDWHAAWAPPRDLGPLPAALGARARALLDRQGLAVVALAERATATAAASRAAVRVRASSRPSAVPLFVDRAV